MSKNVDIAIILRDQYSGTINKLKSTNTGWNKSLDETAAKIQQYNLRLQKLNKEQGNLQVSVIKARKEMQEAAKQFKKTADAADEEKVKAATEKYNKLKQELALTGQTAAGTEKQINSMMEAIRKADVKQTSGKLLSGSSEQSLVSRLGAAGATSMLGQLASSAAGYVSSGLLGSAGGNYFSSAMSSGAMGAAIGTAIAPGIGSAIGAVLGGISGMVQAFFDEQSSKDDTYRSRVQELYATLAEQQAAALQGGSGVAAGRETTRMSFNTLIGEEAAAALLADVQQFSNLTPYTFDQLTGSAKSALAYGYASTDVMSLLQSAGNASAALGAGSEGLSTIIDVLGRANMGTLENEQLKRLINLGINPYALLANASNNMATNGAGMIASGMYSEEEIANIQSMMEYVAKNGEYTGEVIKDMVSKGLIPAQMAAAALADQMGEVYAGALEAQSQTYEGLESTVQGLTDDLNAAMGTAYNAKIKEGMQEQIAFLQGEGGDLMKEAYSLIGTFEADLINKKDELTRDSIQSIMSGTLAGDWTSVSEEYKAKLEDLMADYDVAKAEENGAEMGRIISAAKALAESEYTNTEEYQMYLDSQKNMIADVQEAVAGSYYDAGYELSQELTKGYLAGAAGLQAAIAASLQLGDTGGFTETTNGFSILSTAGMYESDWLPHAYGLNYVPYDNYPALLHEGERVLTASEARSQTASVSIAKLADSIVIREEADIDRFAAALADRIVAAGAAYGG